MRITASNLVAAISRLSKDCRYDYISTRTKTKVQILEVVRPLGPIYINRYCSSEGEDVERVSISSQMICRIANAIKPGCPINIDRILGASYNTRAALEALLAHTSEFYYSYPGRIEMVSSTTEIKKGHKHLIWMPDCPHQDGVIEEIESDMVISEMPSTEAIYEALVLSDDNVERDIDIELKRRHAQIQFAIYTIGRQLGSKVWIAQNDKSIEYRGKKIAEMDGVIGSLRDIRLLAAFEEAQRAALFIDAIWFKNGKIMPAVFEIEHSTGVTSGLSRMKNFQDNLPEFPTRYVIVAPDEIRDKVYTEANKRQFLDLNLSFFPYSSVEELYSLCQKRKIQGVTDEFLDCFMEKCLAA